MSRNEFIDAIKEGYDILFNVENRKFTILTWTDKGICIGEQYKNNEEYYDTVEDLLEGFKIDNTPLGNLAEKVVITDYT